jgi:hypothetical protein
MDEFIKFVGLIVVGIVALVGFVLLATIPVYFSWNNFFPMVFGVKEITFTQALWLSIFIGLFKSSTSS